jgi:replication factor C large subunit
MTHHCKNRELTVAMAARYDLEEKHVSFVTGSGEDTNKVQSIVEDAQALREELAVEHGGGAFEGESEAGGIDDGDSGSQSEAGGTDDAEDGTESNGVDEAPAQASLDGSANATAGGADDGGEESTEDDPTEDDQQSGLSDFM